MNALIAFLVSCLVVTGFAAEETGFIEWSVKELEGATFTFATGNHRHWVHRDMTSFTYHEGTKFVATTADNKWKYADVVAAAGEAVGVSEDGTRFAYKANDELLLIKGEAEDKTKPNEITYSAFGEKWNLTGVQDVLFSDSGTSVAMRSIVDKSSHIKVYTEVEKKFKMVGKELKLDDTSSMTFSISGDGSVVALTTPEALPIVYKYKNKKDSKVKAWLEHGIKDSDLVKGGDFTLLGDGSVVQQTKTTVDVYQFGYNCKEKYCSKTAYTETTEDDKGTESIAHFPQPFTLPKGTANVAFNKDGKAMLVTTKTTVKGVDSYSSQHYHLKFREYLVTGEPQAGIGAALSSTGAKFLVQNGLKAQLYMTHSEKTGNGLFIFSVVGCIVFTIILIVGAAKFFKPNGTGDEEEGVFAKTEDQV